MIDPYPAQASLDLSEAGFPSRKSINTKGSIQQRLKGGYWNTLEFSDGSNLSLGS
jgi:hypothetical protein